MISCDDVVNASQRISDFLPYPLIVDFGNGFGNTAEAVTYSVKRIIQTEASAVVIDDSDGYGGVVPESLFLDKIKAAVGAGTSSCFMIAAANVKNGFAESIERLKKAQEFGVGAVLLRGLKTNEECRRAGTEIGGIKILDEFSTNPDKQNIDFPVIAEYGFALATVRYLEKASLFGLMNYGLRCKANNDTVYSDYHDWDGTFPELNYRDKLSNHWWVLEKQLKNLSEEA
jgi:2-methylisocitrate lyase-like PEP mutase family enzyme